MFQYFDELCRTFVARDKGVGVFGHCYFLPGHSGLAKTLDDVSVHAPGHGTHEAFRWRRH